MIKTDTQFVQSFSGGGAGYDPEADTKDYTEFANWLQCYYNPDMKNMVDSNKRTIWFSGPAGPLAPTGWSVMQLSIIRFY